MGYSKYMLGTEEVQHITRKCMELIENEPGEPVAFAIVDDAGDIVSCLRMNGAKPFQLELSVCKAFTASIGELKSSDFG